MLSSINHLIKVYKMNFYISNLSYNISDEDLKQLFADYGEITSAKVIIDRNWPFKRLRLRRVER